MKIAKLTTNIMVWLFWIATFVTLEVFLFVKAIAKFSEWLVY